MIPRAVAGALLLLLPACADPGSTEVTTSSGASTGSGLICPQACQDDNVGYGLDKTIWLLWDEDIAGKPSGPVDTMASCPLGGTAHITGSTSVDDNGLDVADLTMDLAACGSSDPDYQLTFTGSVTMHGTFDGSHVGANAITFASASLTAAGTIPVADDPKIQETCPMSVTDTYNPSFSGQQGWLNGTVCGRTSATTS